MIIESVIQKENRTRLEGGSPAFVAPSIRAAAKILRLFWRSRRAVTTLESVCGVCFLVAMMGGVFEVMSTMFVGDVLDRAAHAVARGNALQDPAETSAQLLARARQAIRAEVGDSLNPDALTINIDVYDNPSKMLSGELSQGANRLLGGDGGDMVVVRLRFAPPTPLRRLLPENLGDDFAFQALAVARKEIEMLPEVAQVP